MVTSEAAAYYSYFWNIEGARPLVDTFDEFRDPTTLVETEPNVLLAEIDPQKTPLCSSLQGILKMRLTQDDLLHSLDLYLYPDSDGQAELLASLKGGMVDKDEKYDYRTLLCLKGTSPTLREWVIDVADFFRTKSREMESSEINLDEDSDTKTVEADPAYCSGRGIGYLRT